jgi:monoamine oxidase
VRVVAERGGLRDVVIGDRVVCAIPFTLLRRVEVSPPWPPRKGRAINELYYDAVSRVYLQTRARYWAGESGFAVSDHPIELFDASYRQPGARGILMTYARDSLARRLMAMDEEARVRWAVREVEKIYPGLAANFEGAVTKCWEEDPWARGAYTLFRPGHLSAFYQEIRRPEGRIHFAGEHASPWTGWMQGALWSGLRAAREINEARP